MITLDFETKSEVDLITRGLANYLVDPSTDILMMGYKVDDGPVRQWFPGDKLPDEFLKPHTLYAFNSDFELGVWNNVGVRRYNWPKFDIAQFQDVQALCARVGLPQRLALAAKVLQVPTQKDEFGAQLIKLFCCPPFGNPEDLVVQWHNFLEYNRHDVEATYQVLKALPFEHLDPKENAIWILNHKINTRGIPVAVEDARQIQHVVTEYLDEHNSRLPDLTNGLVTKVTQVARIKTWLESRGYPMESLTADVLQKTLQRDDLPDDVLEVLELRAGLGLSSLGKYKRMHNEECNGRVYYNSKYYGAHTGRVTGSGLQLLNLPRASVKDPESEIGKFYDLSIVYDNPVISARALVRSMVCADEGDVLLAADYSSIEYVLLMYLAGDMAACRRFNDGVDQYKDLAASIYGIPYDKVTKQQRQMGKMGILGCGYGLGALGFVQYADRWGVRISFEEATEVVGNFRKLYSNARNMWYNFNTCALNAVSVPGTEYSSNNTAFKVIRDRTGRKWLRLTLPSGRSMYYFEPYVAQGKFGPNVASFAMDQVTKTWRPKYMWPGKWTENVVQACGRDLLYYGKFKLEEAGYKIIFSVYDEVVAEMPEDKANLKEFEQLMASVPQWCEGLPLRAEGYVSKRYKKG